MSCAAILDAFGRPAQVPRVQARYEATQWSVHRALPPNFIQSVARDLTPGTRRRLLSLSRYIHKNNPLLSAIIERAILYSVGTGIRPEADSSIADFNREANQVWAEFAAEASLKTAQTYYQLQAVKLRSTIVDGDIASLRTYDPRDVRKPRIHLIESHEIGDPDATAFDETTDGVVFDSFGLVSGYRMPKGADGKEEVLPVSSVSLIADLRRPNQYRGVCLLASALTSAFDLHEILALEKAGVKAASKNVDVVKTATGEVDPEDVVRGTYTNANGVQKSTYYREVIGPETKVMQTGDDYELLTSQRPSPAWIGFVDFIAEICCLALNIPPSMVRQLKVGGADTRRDLAIMQRVCEPWQELIAADTRRDWEYVIGIAIDDGRIRNAPEDWRAVSMQFPRAPTVDAGRMAQQDREDVRAGTLTLQEYCGQWGLDWRKHVAQLAREAIEIQATEKQMGLTVGSLTRRIYGDTGADQTQRNAAEIYGIAVRSGALTPNLDDERTLRERLNLPAPNADVERVWREDGGARKPVTIQAPAPEPQQEESAA